MVVCRWILVGIFAVASIILLLDGHGWVGVLQAALPLGILFGLTYVTRTA